MRRSPQSSWCSASSVSETGFLNLPDPHLPISPHPRDPFMWLSMFTDLDVYSFTATYEPFLTSTEDTLGHFSPLVSLVYQFRPIPFSTSCVRAMDALHHIPLRLHRDCFLTRLPTAYSRMFAAHNLLYLSPSLSNMYHFCIITK